VKVFWIKPLLMIIILSLPLAAQAQSGGKPGPVGPVAVQKPSPNPIKVVEEASAPSGWKRYEFGEVPVISALLPARPEEFVDQEALGGDKPSTMRSYTAESAEGVYTAFYMEDLPFVAEKMPEDVKKSFFDGVWEGLAKGMQKGMEEKGLLFKITRVDPRPITLSGLQGVEQDFTLGPMQGRAQMAMAGQRAYMALAFWTEDEPLTLRTAFFNSFRINVKR
jgi:hypothetical protein